MRFAWIALAGMTGCAGDTAPRCEGPEQVLATVGDSRMVCADVEHVAGYRQWLTQQPAKDEQRDALVLALLPWFERSPAEASAWWAELAVQLRERQKSTGLAGALVHSSALYEIREGQGLWERADARVRSESANSLLIWAVDTDSKRALSEPAIEAWIRYISLCRQVQGAGSLNLSVSDRAKIYGVFKERFLNGDPAEQEAVVGFGPYWPEMEAAWQSARYSKQRQWIGEAPLPPPVTSTSLGYVEWFLDHGQLKEHVETFDRLMGPLSTVP